MLNSVSTKYLKVNEKLFLLDQENRSKTGEDFFVVFTLKFLRKFGFQSQNFTPWGLRYFGSRARNFSQRPKITMQADNKIE